MVFTTSKRKCKGHCINIFAIDGINLFVKVEKGLIEVKTLVCTVDDPPLCIIHV